VRWALLVRWVPVAPRATKATVDFVVPRAFVARRATPVLVVLVATRESKVFAAVPANKVSAGRLVFLVSVVSLDVPASVVLVVCLVRGVLRDLRVLPAAVGHGDLRARGVPVVPLVSPESRAPRVRLASVVFVATAVSPVSVARLANVVTRVLLANTARPARPESVVSVDPPASLVLVELVVPRAPLELACQAHQDAVAPVVSLVCRALLVARVARVVPV